MLEGCYKDVGRVKKMIPATLLLGRRTSGFQVCRVWGFWVQRLGFAAVG